MTRTLRIAASAALAIIALTVVLVIGTSNGGTYELRARFDDVRGLIEGGQVRAGAIKVGSVRRVYLDAHGDPEVVMDVDDDFRVHRGATADLVLGSNAGVVNRAIELKQGDTAAPALPDGTTLTRAQTDQPVNFDEAADTFDPQTRENIRRFFASLDQSTRGRGRDIAATLRNAPVALGESANLLAQVDRDGAALRTFVHQGQRAVSALASSPGAIGAAVDRTAAVLRATAGRDAELRASVRLIGPALSRARVMLASLDHAVPNLRALVGGLAPLLDELGPLARIVPRARDAAGPFVKATLRLVASAPASLRGLKPIISAAFPVAETVGPLARSALPLGQAIRAYAPEIAGLFQNFNSAMGGYDKAGHVINLRIGVGPPPSALLRSIDGTDCSPGLIKRPYFRVPGTLECQPWKDFESSFLKAPEAGG